MDEISEDTAVISLAVWHVTGIRPYFEDGVMLLDIPGDDAAQVARRAWALERQLERHRLQLVPLHENGKGRNAGAFDRRAIVVEIE